MKKLISLFLTITLLLALAVPALAEGEVPNILVNQVGFQPKDPKMAVFRDASLDSQFAVVSYETGEVVYTGYVSPGSTGGGSGEAVGWANFSDLTEEGIYRVVGQESGESYPFVILEDVYDIPLRMALRMLYLQRCGCELTQELAGDFAHKACHTQTAALMDTDIILDVSGGWHDAGDYGRYTVPGAKAAADLMLAYEMYPGVFTDDFGIPESGNGVPDVLDEARWELEWLHKLQAPDGGVIHKVTGLTFDPNIMPDESTLPLLATRVTPTATGDFSAVMFLAGRVFQDIDAVFAAQCLDAAWLALSWLEENMDAPGFTNPDGMNTGEYADPMAQDEYLWALCEGWKTTGSRELQEKIPEAGNNAGRGEGLGWAQVTGYALYAAITSGIEGLESVMEQVVTNIAKQLTDDGYMASIRRNYGWGSNLTIANNGIQLLMAEQITGDHSCGDLARSQLNYLLGTNTTGYSFVTGLGSQTPQRPHHRPSVVKQYAVPGMLVCGPNSYLSDPVSQMNLQGKPAAACYIDDAGSYSTNEVAIYLNSALVWLIAGIMDS